MGEIRLSSIIKIEQFPLIFWVENIIPIELSYFDVVNILCEN